MNPRQLSHPAHLTKDLGLVVKDLSPKVSTVHEEVKISDVHAIASYSWIDERTPTIAVPASPRIWSNTEPQRVPQDTGRVFIDQNAYRMGSVVSPLTPMFVAIDDLGGFDYKGLDVVSDRNNLRKLIRWATGTVGSDGFRIDIDVAGRTCLFTRREEKDSEVISGFRGFGHEYEKAATNSAPGCERTTGHHRIISMNLGGLKILLRFEVDACTEAATSPKPNVDDLTAAFTSLQMKSKGIAGSAQKSSNGVNVVHTNPRALVDQDKLIEIKTRASHKPLDWAEIYPQLYLSQTAFLYVAYHRRGQFFKVQKHQLGAEIHDEHAGEGMAKLRDVLVQVLEAARKGVHGATFSLVCRDGRLRMYERKTKTGKVVGEEILLKFA